MRDLVLLFLIGAALVDTSALADVELPLTNGDTVAGEFRHPDTVHRFFANIPRGSRPTIDLSSRLDLSHSDQGILLLSARDASGAQLIPKEFRRIDTRNDRHTFFRMRPVRRSGGVQFSLRSDPDWADFNTYRLSLDWLTRFDQARRVRRGRLGRTSRRLRFNAESGGTISVVARPARGSRAIPRIVAIRGRTTAEFTQRAVENEPTDRRELLVAGTGPHRVVIANDGRPGRVVVHIVTEQPRPRFEEFDSGHELRSLDRPGVSPTRAAVIDLRGGAFSLDDSDNRLHGTSIDIPPGKVARPAGVFFGPGLEVSPESFSSQIGIGPSVFVRLPEDLLGRARMTLPYERHTPTVAGRESTLRVRMRAPNGQHADVNPTSVTIDADAGRVTFDALGTGTYRVFAPSPWPDATLLTPDRVLEQAVPPRRQRCFGSEVQRTGDVLVVSTDPRRGLSPEIDVALDDRAPTVFERIDGAWKRTASLRPAGGPWSKFVRFAGLSVAPDTVLFRDVSDVFSETTFVFQRDGTDWNEEASLPLDLSVVDGNRIVGWAVDGRDRLLLYERLDGAWQEAQQIRLPQPLGRRLRVSQIALEGDSIVVGASDLIAPSTDEEKAFSGAVFVFRSDEGKWRLTQRINPPKRNWMSTRFGNLLALHGDHLVVHEPHASPTGIVDSESRGVLHTYRLNAKRRWIHAQTLRPADEPRIGRWIDELPSGESGSIGLGRDLLTIPTFDETFESASVQVYVFGGEAWRFVTNLPTTTERGTEIWSSDVEGDSIVIGEASFGRNPDEPLSSSGAVHILEPR